MSSRRTLEARVMAVVGQTMIVSDDLNFLPHHIDLDNGRVSRWLGVSRRYASRILEAGYELGYLQRQQIVEAGRKKWMYSMLSEFGRALMTDEKRAAFLSNCIIEAKEQVAS